MYHLIIIIKIIIEILKPKITNFYDTYNEIILYYILSYFIKKKEP